MRSLRAKQCKLSFGPQAGFTLIELVLALVLSGAFLALIAPAIRFAIKQPEQASRHAEASHKALLVSEYIERDLKVSRTVLVSEDQQCIDVGFDGLTRSYCFTQGGLAVTESGKRARALVPGVRGKFVPLNPQGVKLLDLQVSMSADEETALSFSRLILVDAHRRVL